MTFKKDRIILCALFFFTIGGVCYAAESAVVKEFREALRQRDAVRMSSVVKRNRERIPDEVNGLLDDALQPKAAAAEEKEAKFNLAERLARQYKNVTGDEGPLVNQQKRVFESYLSEPVSPAAEDGVNSIVIRRSEGDKGPFNPNNIVIKSGTVVRWINNDSDTHMLSSVNGISTDRIVSPDIAPGEAWEHRFYRPGVYYYLCFIHKEKMYGKITVE
jgi:plastocyanin